MTRNISLSPADGTAPRSIVLVGLMGAGKTTIGRRLAQRVGLPFHDADAEIELAAGRTIAELFERYGEPAFRDGERRVIARLLAGPPIVLATGGGAFMDARTRAEIRRAAVSVWLRADLPTLLRRVAGRGHRPLLDAGDPAEILARLMALRDPIYAEADVVVDGNDDGLEAAATRVADAVCAYIPPQRLRIALANPYEVVIGPGLLGRAGALLAPVLPQKRVFVVCDAAIADRHMPTLLAGLAACAIAAEPILVPSGEASKSLASFGRVVDHMLGAGVERGTSVIALGGGVIGDLAGFAAAATLRGLPFVQIPTTLLAQVDSSVGGKTGINSPHGKNLIGAFHQPRLVIADTDTLATLPPRELRAGYAEICKAGLIGDVALYEWCEANARAMLAGDPNLLAEAVARACAFKAAVVCDDEFERKPNGGRALLNLGHTFGHALEAEYGYDGGLLHGEAVAIGIGLAFRLSARLGLCDPQVAERVVAHLAGTGLPAEIAVLNRRFSAATLIGHMRRDKKMRDGALHFVLARDIGAAFTTADVPSDAVTALLRDQGCEA